jgi:hypothetical protein
MTDGIAFLAGLLDRSGTPAAAAEDFDGPHGTFLRACQDAGFLGTAPAVHLCPSCPHCGEGTIYRIGGCVLCNRCYADVDPSHLCLWPLDGTAFCRWLAAAMGIRGPVRQLDPRLWQLGSLAADGGPVECFFRRRGPLTDVARSRPLAYREVLLVYGLTLPPEEERWRGRSVSLLGLLRFDGERLTVADPRSVLRTRGNVRFDAESGTLWAGDTWLGEVPVGSKEHSFLDCLARQLDRFVPYADLKHFVLRQAGSRDETEEATFCQNLKSRVKKKYVPAIDRLLATTNKGDGYRLRGYVEL